MKFRLKVKMTKRTWKLGIKVYNSVEEAEARKAELKAIGIESIIVDEFGGKLK